MDKKTALELFALNKVITSYSPRTITIPKKSLYEQTAKNCRIYAMINNLYMNTGIKVNNIDIENYIQSFWKDSQTWWQTILSWVLISKFLASQNIWCFEIDILKSPKLFAKMLLAWYSLAYSRTHDKNLTKDIREDWDVDNILTNEWWRHATNICFLNKKLTEFGSRWDSKYNNFVFGTTNTFVKSIKAWTIRREVRFLDFKTK